MPGTAPHPFGRPWEERFPGPAPQPMAAGQRLELREGIRVLGFMPVERRAGLACRAIGPEPEAVLCLGSLPPTVTALRLTFLGPADPERFGTMRLIYEGETLTTSHLAPPPGLSAAVPEAWAVEATLPSAETLPRPERGRLEILLDRVLPDLGSARPGWVGPALHVIEFLG